MEEVAINIGRLKILEGSLEGGFDLLADWVSWIIRKGLVEVLTSDGRESGKW